MAFRSFFWHAADIADVIIRAKFCVLNLGVSEFSTPNNSLYLENGTTGDV